MEDEYIIKIQEGVIGSLFPAPSLYAGFSGFVVVTNQRRIIVAISNMEMCCEAWGYVTSEDDFAQFQGAKLLEIRLVDEALNNRVLELGSSGYGCEEGGAVFVNFETEKGTFQLSIYNEHNGYYGHEVFIREHCAETSIMEGYL